MVVLQKYLRKLGGQKIAHRSALLLNIIFLVIDLCLINKKLPKIITLEYKVSYIFIESFSSKGGKYGLKMTTTVQSSSFKLFHITNNKNGELLLMTRVPTRGHT